MVTKKDLGFPRRVWINAPSTLQEYYNYHTKVGIAVYEEKPNQIRVYFTEGETISTFINGKYLVIKD